jgi:serine/threonine protein kinase
MDSLGSKLIANRFLFRKKISSGSFGVVNLVLDRATNQECALKIEKEENQET